MYKKVSEIQKEEILKSFINGEKIKDLSIKYGFSTPTISRQLKNLLGHDEFLKIKNDLRIQEIEKINTKKKEIDENFSQKVLNNKNDINENYSFNNLTIASHEEFYEISPLSEPIDLEEQKDISSKPIETFDFPDLAYMIVDKKIELEVKILREFIEWEFLSAIDLNRKAIKIFFDLKNARKNCNSDQKVIKIPNTNVFKIVSPILLSRGISRILTEDKLIAL